MTDKDKSVEDAIKLASNRAVEHTVDGYGRQDDGYGGPYHPDAFQDPAIKFALAGAPEAQVKFTNDLKKLDVAKHKDKKTGTDKVDLVAASAHSTVVETAPYRAASQTPELEATHKNVEEAAARKHLITPRSDETSTETGKS